MKTFKVNLIQRNREGIITFEATAASIKVKDENNLSLQIATYCKKTINLTEYFKANKVNWSERTRIKLTHDMEIYITDFYEGTSLEFSIPNFGRLVKESSIEELQDIIYRRYTGKLKVKSYPNEVTSEQSLPQEFSIKNPFEAEQQEIISKHDIFSNREPTTKEIQGYEIKTVFSDFEAFSICSGLDNRHAKHIAQKYFRAKDLEPDVFVEAHQIATKTLEKYGSRLLSYIITLPPLPFKAVNATQIFSELDKRRKTQDFPIIRIPYKNEKNETEKIYISYFAEKLESGRKRNDNILTIKNQTTGKRLMKVSRNGIVIPDKVAKQIVPVLQVFVRFSKDTKKAILNYGLETGECSICGRELTNSESIRRGIGPVCRQYI